MDLKEARKIESRKAEEDEAAELLARQRRQDHATRREESARAQRLREIAEGEATLAALRKSRAALEGVSDDALYRWGAGETSAGLDGLEGIRLPATTQVPTALDRGIAKGEERLRQLQES